MRELIGKGLLTAAAASSVLTLSGGYAQATDSSATAAGSPGLLSGNSVQAPVEIPVNVCGNTVNPVGAVNPSFGNSCANASGAHAAPKPRPAHHGQHHGQQHATHAAPGQETQARPSHAKPRTDASSTHGAGPRENGGGSAPANHGQYAGHTDHAVGADHGGSSAAGAATNSPGLLSGNVIQAPLHIPLNICGNSVDVVGVLNPAFGNACVNGETPVPPGTPHTPHDPPPGDRSMDPPAVPVDHDPRLPEQPRPVEEADFIHQLAATGTDANLLGAAAVSAGLLISGAILYRRNRTGARV